MKSFFNTKKVRRNCFDTLLAASVLLTALCARPLFCAQRALSTTITIAGSAESHGMLESCDCEHSPGGGVAKRASLVESLRSTNSLLLLDAGGFCGGGIYDEYTGGRAVDSIRSERMTKAMGMMRYDAVAIGDDDLQYGGRHLVEQARRYSLPLVCANCRVAKDKPLVQQYIVVSKAGLRIGITAVTTPERLFPIDTLVKITEPVAALRSIWKEMCRRSDVQVILSHLGQDGSMSLSGEFPECDIILNGHRKSGRDAVTMVGNAALMQFGFQGKSLSGLRMRFDGGDVRFDKERWLQVAQDLPDAPQYAALTDEVDLDDDGQAVYDLYIMSLCPYGVEALGEFMRFVARRPSIEWNIRFIGSITNDTLLSSLHGEKEVEDEKIWLGIKALYPGKWSGFLRERCESDLPTARIVAKMELDYGKISEWVRRNGQEILRDHYRRSMRIAVNSSPTLLVNNRPFGRNITEANLRRYQCLSVGDTSPVCDSLPQCGEDADCRSPGKLGLCRGGTCEFRDALSFVFTALIADSTFEHPEEDVIRTTTDLFPGAQIRVVTLNSKEGGELMALHRPKILPLYIFGKEVKLAHNFSSVGSGLVDCPGGFTFRDGIVQGNYLPQRKRIVGATALYIDPFFSELPEVFGLVNSDTVDSAKKISVEPVVYIDPQSVVRGTIEWFRQEEALRWIAMKRIFPAAYRTYLAAYASAPGGSNWQRFCAGTGVSADSLYRAVSRSSGLLIEHWKTISQFDSRLAAILLVDNVQMVPVTGADGLRHALKTVRRP